MDQERTLFACMVTLIVSAFIIVLCITLMLFGVVRFSVDCFAVDSSGKLYIGQEGHIHVYEDSKLVRTISEFDGLGSIPVKGFVFTIEADDTITMATGGHVISMDLEGKVLETQKDTAEASVRSRLESGKYRFRSSNGDMYRLKSSLGRTSIVKNDAEVVYQISALSFAAKIALCIAIVSFIASLIGYIVIELKEQAYFR